MRFQWLCVCLRLGAGPQVALKPWIKRWFTVASSFERQSGGRFKRPLPKWAKYESFVSSWKCYQCCWGDRGAGEEKQIPCKTNCCLFTSCVLHIFVFAFKISISRCIFVAFIAFACLYVLKHKTLLCDLIKMHYNWQYDTNWLNWQKRGLPQRTFMQQYFLISPGKHNLCIKLSSHDIDCD